jgi:hypothetical protein
VRETSPSNQPSPKGAHEQARNDEYDRSRCRCTFEPTGNQAVAEDKQSENGEFNVHVNSLYANESKTVSSVVPNSGASCRPASAQREPSQRLDHLKVGEGAEVIQ